jgi:hypothetical protein
LTAIESRRDRLFPLETSATMGLWRRRIAVDDNDVTHAA